MIARLLSPASRYSLLFATTVGLFFILSATGLYSRFFFSLALTDQALFLAHLLLGWLFVLPFTWYFLLHLRLVLKTKALKYEYASHLLGIALLVTTLVALVSGADLSIAGSSRANKAIIDLHTWSAYAAMFLLPTHILLALSRRLSARRASSIPVEDRFLAPAAILASSIFMAAAASLAVPPPTPTYPIPADYTYVKNQKGTKEPFFPGQARTIDGKLIPIDHLSQSDRCQDCHQQIFDEWNHSAHRFAAVNDHYVAQVKLRINDVPLKPHMGARFCANCHEPIALFSGEIDRKGRGVDFKENRQQGISCLACHHIEALHSGILGNANMIVSPHRPYMFEKNATGAVRAVGNMVLRSKPDIHRDDLMRPLLRKSEFCSTCHKFSIDEAINGHGFFRLQNTFDEWKLSSFGDEKNPNFQRCQDCHMPLVPSEDPAAKAYTDKDGKRALKHRSHLWLGANTARPFLDGDQYMLEETQKFLTRGDVTLSLDAPADAKPGDHAKVKVTVMNKSVGHRFPTGTVDTHDVWVELEVKDAKGVSVFHSGALDAQGNVDPDAHTFNAKAVDEDGNWLYRRDMWNLAGFEKMVTVFPGNFNSKVYEIPVPAGTVGPLAVEAKLNYRKLNQKFTRFVFGRGKMREESGYEGKWTPDVRLPITMMSSDRATIALKP